MRSTEADERRSRSKGICTLATTASSQVAGLVAEVLDAGLDVRQRPLLVLQDGEEGRLAAARRRWLEMRAGRRQQQGHEPVGAVETAPQVVVLPALPAEEGPEVP